MFKQFPTVHCHPASVIDSASTPAQFVKREVELGTGYVTATDHGSLAGAKEIFDLGKKAGLTPIIGLEAYLRDDNCSILLKNGIPQSKEMVCGRCHEKWKNETTPDCSCGASSGIEKKHFRDYLKYMHLTMHFRDYPAYLTGVRLLTKADLNGEQHGSERKPIFTWEDIEELAAQNVTMTSSCLIGVVQRHLVAHSNMDIAFQYFDKFHSMCGNRFYAEVFPHKTDKNWTQGVRITTEDGTKHRYYFGKKVLTNKSEIQVSSLASDWLKNNHGGHIEITAIKNNRTWEQISPPWKIKDVELLEGFTPNECTFWSSDGDHQKGCNEFIIELAKSYDIPVVIGDDSHYANKEDKIVQDIKLAQSGNWRFYGHYHRQSSQEAYEHFNNTLGTSTSEFERWVDNSLAWAEGFKGFNFESKPRLPIGFYPGDSLERTIALIEKHGRMQWDNPVYVNRLYYELELMHSNGKIDLLPYFFPLEEVCNSYSERGELTGPGRGSAAGTLLTYLLEITHADPIKYKLSIDRFITMDRIKSGALPDIDQDLPDREALTSRGGWLEKRFGDCFAQISVDTKMKLKSAVKDVHRALYGYVAPDVEAFTKRFGAVPQGVDDHDHVFGHTANGTWVPGAIETDIALKEYVEKYPKEWDIVQQCLGLCRNKGRHACAFIIADEAISNFIPLTEVGGERVTQFTAKSVESVGGIKYDLLTINSLQDISTAIQLIQSRSGLTFDETILDNKKVPKHRLIPRNGKLEDIWNLPEDQDVFDDVADSKTESVFQFNTAGARQWMAHFNHNRPDGKPIVRSVYDLSVFAALDRPGPLDIKVINPEDDTKHNALVEYARRARGLTPSPEIPEVIASLLPETYGIMVFQEQLQYAYQMLMNCSGAEAEEFRRAVAKKDASKIQKKYEPFIERAALKVGSREAAKSVWDFFSSWSSYGFNLSHSVCYALIGYACAYLKHHFPLEWWCAVLRHAKKEEIAETFWAHAGHLIDLPDIRYSGENFEIHGKRIRAPFSLVDGVGPTAHQQLLDGRPYTSLDDFVAKAKSKGRALHSGICYKLIVTGILNPLFKSDNIFDRLAEYEQAVANYLNSKEQPVEVLPSGKIKKKALKKPESIDSRYANLTATERYQLIKQVMPVYSEDIRKLVAGTHLHKTANGKWYLRAPEEAAFSEEIIEVLDRRGFEEAEAKPFKKPVRIALVAYVQSVREFSPKNNRAWELTLDMAGGLRQTVYWGYGNSNPEELVEGAILGFILKKSKPDRDFSVECWRVLAKHLKDIEELPKPPTVWSHKYETPSGAVDIQRGSKWGNPYSHLTNSTAIYKTKTVEEAVKSYESWIMTQPSMLASLKELKGKHLVCACPPKKGLGPTDDGGYRCHGQILLRMAAAV